MSYIRNILKLSIVVELEEATTTEVHLEWCDKPGGIGQRQKGRKME